MRVQAKETLLLCFSNESGFTRKMDVSIKQTPLTIDKNREDF